jgi:hypothetical protein
MIRGRIEKIQVRIKVEKIKLSINRTHQFVKRNSLSEGVGEGKVLWLKVICP